MTHAAPTEPRSTKSGRFQLRVSDEEQQLIRDAAAAVGESVSGFLLGSALDRAGNVLADRRRFVLDPEQWEQFVAALDRPVTVKPRLRELLSQPSVLEQ